jgi:hypothetical protein
MTDEKFEEYLKERYREQINYYSSKARTNKKLYSLFQWSVIIISAIMPVVVVSYSDNYRWAAAALSLLLAVGTSGLKAFKFQENWMNYRQVAETLRQEEYFYGADLGPYATAADKRAMFVDRVESLISLANAIWVTVHHQKEASASDSSKR